MRALMIGGNRFLGVELGFRLLAAGYEVTLLNRGTLVDPFGGRVSRLVADRTTDAFDHALEGKTFDAVFDFAVFTKADAERAARVLRGRAGHYLMVSTGQVYLVRQGYTWPAREADYDGPTIAEPSDADDHHDWVYGMDKRAAEDVISASDLPATRLRLPMVNGPRDYYRRIESYLWRLLDGGPILLPGGGLAPARHVYGTAVARTLAAIAGRTDTFGEAYNLAQDEAPTVRELVTLLRDEVGSSAPIVPVAPGELAKAGLRAVEISPFSGAWMSCLDPTKAKVALGFRHEPLASYLSAIVTAHLSSLPGEPPASYAHRAAELQLARALSAVG